METTTSHILLSLMGGIKSKQQENLEKSRLSRFYEDFDDFNQGEVIFCKNNVCIFNRVHVPGYLTLKACTINNEYTRLILHWISNELLQESLVTDDEIQDAVIVNKSDDSKPTVFHIDLTEMRFLKCFFNEDQTSGHFVVGNHENHYKVFHFHLDGMIHLVEIFENWNLCRTIKLPPEERARKKAFSIIPLYTIFPNQSFEESRYCPMTKARWKCFLNKSGQLEDVSNFRKEVYYGGVFPDVRKEIWPFLLHFYPFHSRAWERKNIREQKMKEYQDIEERRLNMPKVEYDKFWLDVQCTVDKDVVRTDRSHPYFAGTDNPNLEIMRKILLNYAYYQPDVGYSQGMSDLVASLLSTLQDEVDAFWCFVGLLERSMLITTPKDDSMDYQLLYLKELLRLMATKFYAHLLLADDGMDLLFCHRWLLLGFKREFHDWHVMRMWEACWSQYQTEFFHIFIAVAIIVEYGDPVWQRSMRVDEILSYFNNLAMEMDGNNVLKKARSLLYQFRRLAGIPCTLRGLLSGPGAWDSATLPVIECSCHYTETCIYSDRPRRGKTIYQNDWQERDEKAETLINSQTYITPQSSFESVRSDSTTGEHEFCVKNVESDSSKEEFESSLSNVESDNDTRELKLSLNNVEGDCSKEEFESGVNEVESGSDTGELKLTLNNVEGNEKPKVDASLTDCKEEIPPHENPEVDQDIVVK
ncbi:TBC1 domain family member 16-like isoform X2 [Xenia sp. Carnegie-2017]|uniref:TBC1 domain family member 16-like isoform X2 n=1 Tax=Xenia sp. Carnegie-2017 TaxID=2897299 RepID=UPI001F04C829|nr:TBC1 domain family member 16-like isoform X2 [Xenia sp. Carnegie-2017]